MIPDQPGTISRPKKQHFDTQIDEFKPKIHGAKHSPLPSSLDRPSADSGGPRANAFF